MSPEVFLAISKAGSLNLYSIENARANQCYFGIAADVKKLVEGQGATFSTTVTGDCTHLVTNQREVDNNNSKCKLLSNLPIFLF